MEQNIFLDEITRLQNNFYSKQNKNLFFKTKQKNECANIISTIIDIDKLISNSIYILNGNIIYFDYLIFKTFANQDSYTKIVNYIIQLFSYCIHKFGNFEFHLNIDTFTISACQRHINLIKQFNNECFKSETQFSSNLKSMHIYNTPNIIDNINTILSPLIDTNVKNKIYLHNKLDSPNLIKKMFSTSSNI